MKLLIHSFALFVLLFLAACSQKETRNNVVLGQHVEEHVVQYLRSHENKQNPLLLIMTQCSRDTSQFNGYFIWNQNTLEKLVVVGYQIIEGHDCILALQEGAMTNSNRDILKEIKFYPKESQIEFEVFHLTAVRDSVIYSD